MRFIKLSIILLVAVSPKVLNAQNVVSFMAGSFQNSGMSLAFSAGETVVGNFESSSFKLIGGFSSGYDLIFTSAEKADLDIPVRFSLSQNYPNPFNPTTSIRYEVPKTADVKMEVFSTIGAKVAVLLSDRKSAGSYTIRFEASHLASGMYFYRFTADGKVISTQKMLLIK